MCVPQHMLEGNLYKSVLSFEHVGPGDPTKVVRLGISLSTESSSQPLCDVLQIAQLQSSLVWTTEMTASGHNGRRMDITPHLPYGGVSEGEMPSPSPTPHCL